MSAIAALIHHGTSRAKGTAMEFESAGRLSQQRLDDFVQAYLPCERRIMGYISSLVPNRTDAEDISQEVCLVLWQKFDDFVGGTDFAAWAYRIAFLKVLNHRRKQPRPIALSEEVINCISAEFLHMDTAIDAELRALGPCLDELTAHHAIWCNAGIVPIARSSSRPTSSASPSLRCASDFRPSIAN